MLSMSKEHHHTVNYGGGSIGIFACVSAKCTGQLHLIKDGWYHVQKKLGREPLLHQNIDDGSWMGLVVCQ